MFFHENLVKLDSQWQFWILLIKRIPKHLKPKISQPKLHQIKHVGGVLQFPWWAESKTVIGWPSWHSFQGKMRETSCWEIREITAIIMPSWDTIEESWFWEEKGFYCFISHSQWLIMDRRLNMRFTVLGGSNEKYIQSSSFSL